MSSNPIEKIKGYAYNPSFPLDTYLNDPQFSENYRKLHRKTKHDMLIEWRAKTDKRASALKVGEIVSLLDAPESDTYYINRSYPISMTYTYIVESILIKKEQILLRRLKDDNSLGNYYILESLKGYRAIIHHDKMKDFKLKKERDEWLK